MFLHAPDRYVAWINEHPGFNPRSQPNSNVLADFLVAALRANIAAIDAAHATALCPIPAVLVDDVVRLGLEKCHNRLVRSKGPGQGDFAVTNDAHHFEFDLDKGIRAQVIEKLEASPLLPLEKGVGPAASGIYALYYKGRLVYLGKATMTMTKSKRTLRSRLNEHVDKISSRANISLGEMSCRYLTFPNDWWVFAAELSLISYYQPEWNFTGFGSKVPGAGRPGTHRISPWDKLFPKKPGNES